MQERWRQAKREVKLDGFSFLLDPKNFRPVPTDWIPRVIPKDEWDRIGKGVEQRLKAINCFLGDLYAGTQTSVPDDVIYTCQFFYPEYQGFRPAKDVFVHIYGIDLVHVGNGQYVVLEDNLRIPSGIAYQLKTVEIAEKVLPELADAYDIVGYDIKDTYLDLFASLCDQENPTCVLLTDSKFGAAFFEHRYLADLLGIPLVEGSDLYIGLDGRVYAKNLDGDVAIDLIYRRVEDLEIFTPGLTEAYLHNKGGPGQRHGRQRHRRQAGLPLGSGNDSSIPGRRTHSATSRQLRLEPYRKPTLRTGKPGPAGAENPSGLRRSGRLHHADVDLSYRSRIARHIIEQPRAYIAQETLDFSKHLIFDETTGSFEERYVDLRVFAVQNGRGEAHAFPGDLTRVANANSRITNNSSGGLCKPTWVIR